MVDTVTHLSHDFSLHWWLNFFKKNNVKLKSDDDFIGSVSTLSKNGLPIILGGSSLAALLHVSVHQLNLVLGRKVKYYRDFYIKKRSGGSRKISMPYPMLLLMQRRILKDILNKYSDHVLLDNVHGYCKGRSIISNAGSHKFDGNELLLKIDIEDFFGSIRFSNVNNAFLEMGYSEKVARQLALICTYQGSLPQGAPTSAPLSNIVFMEVDAAIASHCHASGLTYTRYADDVSISGCFDESFFIGIKNIITSAGFRINEKKTKVHKCDFNVTGVSVTKDGLRLPKKLKSVYRSNVYYLKKYGMLNCMKRHSEDGHVFPEKIYGQLRYWLQVEGPTPEVTQAFHVYWDSMVKDGLK